MKTITYWAVACIAAVTLAACGAPASNAPANTSNAVNSNTNTAKPVAAAPTKGALMAIEKSGWEAWKTRDAKWTEDNYSDKGVSLGSTGRMDKAAMIKAMGRQKCDIKSYSLSDDKMQMAGPDVAILTFKGAQDATCDGKTSPANVWAASVYVREGDRWKAAFYAEAPVVDPKAAPAKPTGAAAAKKDEAKPAAAPASDPATDALMAVETKAWEAWKNKDAKGLDDFAAKDMIALSSTEGWTDRAATLKRWGDPSCEIKSVKLTDPASVAYNSDYAMLTFKSTVDGKSGNESVPAEWGATLYGKEGGVWKALMALGLPAS
ncbi:MAG: nuclear transport factor 2 family protein [Pyrinomonadaceae bacterium]